MNDDLNLIISYICSSKRLHKVAVSIEHGMNNEIGKLFKYYAEPDNLKLIKAFLPIFIANHIDTIVGVEEIFTIARIPEMDKNSLEIKETFSRIRNALHDRSDSTVTISVVEDVITIVPVKPEGNYSGRLTQRILDYIDFLAKVALHGNIGVMVSEVGPIELHRDKLVFMNFNPEGPDESITIMLNDLDSRFL